MRNNLLRIGNFTSSEIADLMKNGRAKGSMGQPAYTYIKDKIREKRLKRSIDNESNARPLSWGKIVESRVFDLLGLEYQLVSDETICHPNYPFWAGSADANKFDEGKTVVDVKSPMTLGSFCDLVDPLYEGLTGLDAINRVREQHKDGERYYWQLVSNSILQNAKFAELIVYVPYLSELQEIRDIASNLDSDEQYKYYWIVNSNDEELPYLLENEYYKNVNIIRFEVPESDKKLLEERVILASKELIGINV